jgi:hypothetical protein
VAFSDGVLDVFERIRQEKGGLAGTYAQARGTTTNTKAMPATACFRLYLARGTGDGLNRDTCVFVVRADAFASGFSLESPVVPRAGDLYTPTGETVPWTIQVASERGAGAYYRLDATRDRAGWDS